MPTTKPSSSDQGSSPAQTTFVQADPSTFRALVQKLTGATPETFSKHPVTVPTCSSLKPVPADMGPRRPAFKLQERRQHMRKLEIALASPCLQHPSCRNLKGEMLLVSPVSPLDHLFSFSPRTPTSPCLSTSASASWEEEEERAIAGKGFYLHRSPLNTPRTAEPELLPLFPLHSPRDSSSSSSSSWVSGCWVLLHFDFNDLCLAWIFILLWSLWFIYHLFFSPLFLLWSCSSLCVLLEVVRYLQLHPWDFYVLCLRREFCFRVMMIGWHNYNSASELLLWWSG